MEEQVLQPGPQEMWVCSWEGVKAWQVWSQSQERWRFSIGACSGLNNSKGKKCLKLKVENKSPTLQEDEEQGADKDEGLPELSWEAAELHTVICNVNQKYTRISSWMKIFA